MNFSRPVLDLPERPETQEECLSDLRRLFQSQLFTDVSLEIDGRRIPAHKAVLAQRCNYFHAMFTSSMQESQQRVVSIEGFSYDVMHAVVKFLYTGVLDIPPSKPKGSAENNGRNSPEDLLTYNKDIKFPFVEQVLQAADFYGLDSLVQLCVVELVDMAMADWSNIPMAVKLFNLGQQLDIFTIKDRGAFLVAQQLSRKVFMDEDISEQYTDLSSDLCVHMREVWEVRLHQPPILVGNDKALVEYLQSDGASLSLKKTEDLISAGASPAYILALHCLCLSWDSAQHCANFTEVSRLIDLFINEGCAINGLDAVGLTPLHIAAVKGAQPLIRKLLDCGASPHSKCRCHNQAPIQKVRAVFDEQMAHMMLVTGDTNGALVVGTEKYEEVRDICKMLTEAETVDLLQQASHPVEAPPTAAPPTSGQAPPITAQSPPTTKQAPPSSKSPSEEINEYFVDALFQHNELTESARVEFEYKSMGVTRWEFEDTLLEFMYPRFGQQLRALCQKGETTGAGVESKEGKQVGNFQK